MDSLPSEILSEIFTNALPDPHCSLFDNIKVVDPSTIHAKLCLVSRHWNETVVTTPALWTSITFTTSSSHTVLERRLKLSKSLPLDVLLDIGNCPEEQLGLRYGKGFKALWRTYQRWRSFQLRGLFRRKADFLDWTPAILPLLRELVVGVQLQNHRLQVAPNDVILAIPLPCLTKLTIQHPDLLKLINSAENVRTLTLHSSCSALSSRTPVFDLRIISRLRNLEVLEIAGTWRVAVVNVSGNANLAERLAQRPRIQLPRLKTIIFFQATTALIRLFMKRLDSPVLGTLVLHSYSHPPLSNLARDKGQLPELKLLNDQIIPIIRLQTAWVHELPPLIQKIPKYAQHKLELCVLAPRLRYKSFMRRELTETHGQISRQNGGKSWDWLKEHVPKAQLMKVNHKGEYERHPACKGPGLPSLDEVVAQHS